MNKKILVLFNIIAFIGFGYFYVTKPISYSVTINASVEEVWNYVSDSSNVSEWSVFSIGLKTFSHKSDISTYPTYRYIRSEGVLWDETVLRVIPQGYRQIKAYNITGFGEVYKNVELNIEQFYEKLSVKSTRLTFSSKLTRPINFEVIKRLESAKDSGLKIMRNNLENIKAAIENKKDYKRLHSFEKNSAYDL